jgi:hypothetical protein
MITAVDALGRVRESRTILDANASANPALATLQDHLYLVWSTEDSIVWTRLTDGGRDGVKRIGAGTSGTPSLAVTENRIYMTWRGVGADPAVYWATFDGNGWSVPEVVPSVQTRTDPALGTNLTGLFVAWSDGSGGEPYLSWTSGRVTPASSPPPRP